MHIDYLYSLKCPKCEKPFKVREALYKTQGRLIHGVISCGCSNYPVANGILFLAKGRIRFLVEGLVNRHKKTLRNYAEIPLFLFRFPYGYKPLILLVVILAKINLFKRFPFNRFIAFLYAFRIINKDWRFYVESRNLRQDFAFSESFARLIKNDSPSLDAGCGTGQLLKLLSARTKPDALTGVDFSIINLYIARKYFSPKSNLIYLNLNEKLPFQSGFFNYIFCNDVLHYVKRQKDLSWEFQRIFSGRGAIFLGNLHNIYFSKSFSDPVHYPLSLKGYLSLFPEFKHSLFSDENYNKGRLEYVPQKEYQTFLKRLKTFGLVFFKNKNLLFQKDHKTY